VVAHGCVARSVVDYVILSLDSEELLEKVLGIRSLIINLSFLRY
jgi:hypothetical protein